MKRNARARSIPDYVDTLDGFRAVATFLVLIFHYWQQSWVSMVVRVGPVEVDFTPIVSIGSLGVELLFALSGFCLYYPFALHPQRRLHAGNYAYKRMVRILPTYFLCVIVCSVYQVGRLDPALLREQFIGNMTLTQMSTPSLAYNHLNPVLWSIAIEAQFYLLFPLLLPLFRKKALLGHGGGVRHRRGLADVPARRRLLPDRLADEPAARHDRRLCGRYARGARRWAGQARARRRTARRAAPCVHAGGDDVRRNVLSGRDVHRRAALRERSGKSLAAANAHAQVRFRRLLRRDRRLRVQLRLDAPPARQPGHALRQHDFLSGLYVARLDRAAAQGMEPAALRDRAADGRSRVALAVYALVSGAEPSPFPSS